MFNLVYASLAAEGFSTAVFTDWLPAFRAKNTRLGVTGLLLYQDGAFMQALAGDEATVRALYATIREDSRHHRVLTLLTSTLTERQFPDWSMGFKSIDAADFPSGSGCSSFLELQGSGDELSWRGSVAKCWLETFKLRLNEALSSGRPEFTPDPRRPRY